MRLFMLGFALMACSLGAQAGFIPPVAWQPDRQLTLTVELPNRGRKLSGRLNRAPVEAAQSAEGHPGDGWLYRRGWSVASIGWQWDVIRSDRLLGLVAPPVLVDGLAVGGQKADYTLSCRVEAWGFRLVPLHGKKLLQGLPMPRIFL